MSFAREKGHLKHHDDQVLVFTDLAPEALEKKRELKEIMAALRDANIRHKWVTPIKLQVSHKGKSYFIKNETDGIEVLQLLGISTPMTTEKTSFKRKSDTIPTSPNKPPKFQRNRNC